MEKLFQELGLDPISMLIYLGILLLFVVGFTLILIKPVQKIINDRRTRLDETFEENKKLSEDSAALKKEYEAKLKEVRQEVARISDETIKNAEKKRDEIITDAVKKSDTIISGAKSEMEAERERMMIEFKHNVKELSLGIAETILEREVNTSDNQKIIDEVLEKWAE